MTVKLYDPLAEGVPLMFNADPAWPITIPGGTDPVVDTTEVMAAPLAKEPSTISLYETPRVSVVSDMVSAGGTPGGAGDWQDVPSHPKFAGQTQALPAEFNIRPPEQVGGVCPDPPPLTGHPVADKSPCQISRALELRLDTGVTGQSLAWVS